MCIDFAADETPLEYEPYHEEGFTIKQFRSHSSYNDHLDGKFFVSQDQSLLYLHTTGKMNLSAMPDGYFDTEGQAISTIHSYLIAEENKRQASILQSEEAPKYSYDGPYG